LQAYRNGDQFCLHNIQVGHTASLPSDLAPQTSTSNQAFDLDGNNGQAPIHMEFPIADEDWDLQGVDVALFDSLFRGLDGENW
jgi:hypothetical protein